MFKMLAVGGNSFIVAVIDINQHKNGIFNQEKNNCFSLFVKDMLEIFENKEIICETAEIHNGRIAVLISCQSSLSFKEFSKRVHLMFEKLLENCKQCHNFRTYVGISEVENDSAVLPELYKEAVEALDYGLFMESDDFVFLWEVLHNRKKEATRYPEAEEEKILRALKAGDCEKIEAYAESFVTELERQQASPEFVRHACMQLLHVIIYKLRKLNVSYTLYLTDKIEKKVACVTNISKMRKLLKKCTRCSAVIVCKRMKEKNKANIQTIIEYLNKNYAEEVSLEDIAEEVNLSPNYLASFFKKNTGVTIYSYLTEIRISKSKELLLQKSLRISEIAHKVSYRDAKHFGQVFKKHVGILPSQYRNNAYIIEQLEGISEK